MLVTLDSPMREGVRGNNYKSDKHLRYTMKVSFECPECQRGWTSALGRVIVYYFVGRGDNRDKLQYLVQLGPQLC